MEDINTILFFIGIAIILYKFFRKADQYVDLKSSSDIINTKELGGKKKPGNMFAFMLDVKIFLKDKLSTKDYEYLDKMKVKLKRIIINVNDYHQETYGVKIVLEKEIQIITQNIALCFKSFLDSVKTWKEKDDNTFFNYFQYRQGVKGLMKSINKYYLGDIDDLMFMKLYLIYKDKMFNALFKNRKINIETTKKFVNVFIPSVGIQDELTKSGLRSYCEKLDEWRYNKDSLWEIEDKYILPLFTVRNILTHCLDNFENKEAMETAKNLLLAVYNNEWEKTIYYGMTYSKIDFKPIWEHEALLNESVSVRETNETANDTKDYDKKVFFTGINDDFYNALGERLVPQH